ncbi:MAG: M42 family metallopeptidase [Firmicutes bacterium]|nr:M42 family metallopeptidase [Bacillota bacterium]
MKIKETLAELSNLRGVSGAEAEVSSYLADRLEEGRFEVRVDSIGNLLVRKGRKKGKKLMLSAHMDEVGLMIMDFEKNGLLRFRAVGGIDSRILVAKRLRVGIHALPGVIGSKPIHLQKKGEQDKPFREDSLYIDCGFKNHEEAAGYLKVGEYATFDVKCAAISKNAFRGKAFDNRAGCLVLLSLLLEKNSLSFDAAFTVQEEVGTRGAQIAAYTMEPDRALVVESTAAADTPETEQELSSTILGQGPAISLMDSTVMVDRQMRNELTVAAEKAGIIYQYRRFTGAGTDGGAIAYSRSGVKTAVLSVPCRYIHSPHSVLYESDLKSTIDLVRSWLDTQQ